MNRRRIVIEEGNVSFTHMGVASSKVFTFSKQKKSVVT